MKYKVIEYLNYSKLDKLEKLYFDLAIVAILSFISFLTLAFKFFVYNEILVFSRLFFVVYFLL
ncbi:hypothetical protein [Campylobacter taeniopygiae]|uniref:hypothetical protein n=1 Tax=Campylobacter taeniopygiae TaxID=2510188 RepID=UPI001FEC26C6|nr:hypothetical protein [Campylobacter taeniopygiae]